MSEGRAKLELVSDNPKELGLYAETKLIAEDRERWRRLHERSDSAPAISLPDRFRRRFRGPGVRRERGALKIEDFA